MKSPTKEDIIFELMCLQNWDEYFQEYTRLGLRQEKKQYLKEMLERLKKIDVCAACGFHLENADEPCPDCNAEQF